MPAADPGSGIFMVVLGILILAFLFVIGRKFVLWYFRIDERVDLLTDIRDSLRTSAAVAADLDVLERNPRESTDQYNSRVASHLEENRRVKV
jgi:hypothetical protein